ncbi:MAG: hypothetical protein KAW14_05745 [Candidatus Aegiribacteria sp.]|nr:hypothetical protein [Candidatus Aegiribacteria sp.]
MNNIYRMLNMAVFIPILILPEISLSNGGPFDSSNILNTGNITFENIEDIRLVSESISFMIDQDYVNVEVIYELVNEGDAREVAYAFPVEYAPIRWHPDDLVWIDEDVPWFRIMKDLEVLDVSTYTDPDSFECEILDMYRLFAHRRWFMTELSFNTGETIILTVQYRFKTLFQDFLTTKSFFPGYDNRLFRYILNPAGNWGSGIVENFSYEIDFSSVFRNHGSVIAVPETGVWISDGVYRFTQENFNIAEADTIGVIYEVNAWKMADYFREFSIPDECIERIRVSSTLDPQRPSDYSISNLLDMDFQTAWVEGSSGDGTGEWIEIDLSEFSVAYIGILNGYAKDENIYYGNSRIREVRYELTYDKEESSYSYFSGDIEETVDLTDIPWTVFDDSNFSKFVQTIYSSGMEKPISKIRLEILDIYPGDDYDDLCITELIILGYPYGYWENQ